MLPPKVRAVYIKELRDSLRDRRVIVASVLVPVLIYPIMMLGMAEVLQVTQDNLSRQKCTIAVPTGMQPFFDKLSTDYAVNDGLEDLPGLEPLHGLPHQAPPPPSVSPAPAPAATGTDTSTGEGFTAVALKGPLIPLTFIEKSAQDAEKALTSGEIQAYVVIAPDFEKKINNLEQPEIEIRVDQAEHRSIEAEERMKNLFEHFKKQTINERLKNRNLTTVFIKPFIFKTHDVAAPSKSSGAKISFLPLLFIMMIITGSIYPAIDMTAGEKERKTLETLIGAPARPLEIITGKFLAIATLALGNAALNVSSFATTFSVLVGKHSGQFQFPWQALPLTLLILVPLTLFFAALLLAVASFASNNKEAQVYCLPIYLVPVVGMAMTMMPGIELDGPLLLAPVVNVALLIKELFLGHGTAQQIVFVFFSTCLYAAGMVALAARVFAREEVLFSAQGSIRLFLNRKFFKPSPTPRPGDALLLAAMLFPINYHFQMQLGQLLLDESTRTFSTVNFALMVVLPQYLLFLGVPLLTAWYLKIDFKKTFQWRTPSARALLAAVCLAAGSGLIAQQLQAWQSLFWHHSPGDTAYLEKPIEALSKTGLGAAVLVFLMGLTPGICEEHFFRGFLQQGVLRSKKWAALIIVGLVFGAYHTPLFNQPVIMLMGVVLAYVACESKSIWPGVLFHFLHNSAQVLTSAATWRFTEMPKAGEPLPGVPLQILIPAVIVFAIGLLLVRGARAPVTVVEAPAGSAQLA
jgi:sodium transport system permease protein